MLIENHSDLCYFNHQRKLVLWRLTFEHAMVLFAVKYSVV